ncbi:MAG: preprotein translocase subunit SecE [Candidatus Hydrothermae bacterium]|uniref:Protein translocase subunit SecE n=1 Tax=candidate division WOR-3 bacterium TaxID=2052148 RepID=A0A7C0XAC6_UNCW3|nr:preprotein translocase subunit SecE [Candidatus Hydrothermae bacterium]HDM90005.1 preprotein translocase subunit SecE [candidate division WOR-3 bacterium]
MIRKFINFLKESKAELQRVTWPTKEAIIGGTAAVLLLSLILVIYMWVIDLTLSRLFSMLLSRG